MASFEMGMDRDIARVGAGLEAPVESVTRSSGNRGGLHITAHASVDKAGDSFDLLSIEAKKLMLLSAHL